MRQGYFFIITTITLLLTFTYGAKSQFIYINPKPGSSMHQPQTNILLRNGSLLDAVSVMEKNLFTITGSRSGEHGYRATLSDDGKTIIIKPDVIFDWDETVSVTVNAALRTLDGDLLSGTSFSFSTRKQPTPEELERYRQSEREMMIEEYGFDPTEKKPSRGPEEVYDSLTTYQILVNDNPAPGRVFYNNQTDLDPGNTNCFATIIENDGTVAWARDLGINGHDFKINNGYLTYYNYENLHWIMLDSNYNRIDSFQCTNGYESATNGHDFVIYPDGHYYLIAYDVQTIDMSQYVVGGQTNAAVTGFIIQGFDPGKNLVFEWRSWDYIDFTDANNVIPLTGSTVDYVHGNSVEEDPNGNIMYSSRTCCEIVKLNTQTGDIIWRLGGENNQFTFINDPVPEHFMFQHDIRMLPNGHITLFNNGNTQAVQQSAAKEYELNEANLTATLVWQYIHPDVNGNHVFGAATGSVQRLSNGNTLIDWGTFISSSVAFPNFTEVDMQGNILWEFRFDTLGMKSYRAHKYEWDPCSRPTSYNMISTVNGVNVKLSWGRATGAKKFKVNYRPVSSSSWTTVKTQKTKLTLNGLNPTTTYVWRVKTLCGGGIQSNFTEVDTFVTQLRLANSLEAATPLNVTVYPNPTQTELNISIEQTGDNPTVITVFNAMGAEVFYKECGNTEGSIHTINVDALASGVYMLSVFTGNQQVMKKFVKQ